MIYPRLYIAICAILLCTLACGVQLPTKETPVGNIAPVTVQEPNYQVVTVTGNVNIRYNGIATGLVAEKGTRLVGYIDGDVFRLLSDETVWIGCVDVETEKGCKSK